MAQLSGVNVEKLDGGLERLASGTDNHWAYIAPGIPAGAIATAINNGGKGVVITAPYGAEQLGINASFDANNSLTVYKDITEFFRLAPQATLYLFNKDTSADLKAFINQRKEIKGYGLHFTYNTVAANLTSTINAHQTIVNALAAENRLIDGVLLGPDGLNTFALDLFTLNAPQVSVIVGCDNSGKPGVGAALGMLAARKVNENLGSVNIINKPRAKRGTVDYPLTDQTLGKWLAGYLPDGSAVDSLDKSVLNGIIAKGYIVAASYEGYSGVFFEDSYTCVEQTSDYAFIENNRTWNKAARIIRAALLPEVKGVVKKNPQTGFIASTTLTRWYSLLTKAIQRMKIDDEISGFEIYINPEQVVNSTTPVKIKATIVTDGIAHSFEVAVGQSNSI